MFARPLIDGADFALNGKELRGEVALDALPRLADLLADSRGSIAFVLRGFEDDGRLMLEVELAGDCRLRCQRCLGELVYPVAVATSLCLAPAGQVDALDMDDEFEYIEESSQIDVLSLIEDELLLEIPYAPRHSDDGCAAQPDELKRSASPFAVLANLNKKQQ